MNNNSEKNIHWFPGHMKKASDQIKDKLKLVDFVICLLDARSPYSTFNKYLLKIVENKPKLFILNKEDLADDSVTSLWINKLNTEGNKCISLSLDNKNNKNKLMNAINDFIKLKQEKMALKGIKKSKCRAMVIGIPNVGKSTFINYLLDKKQMKAANIPGFTKSISWAKVNEYFEIMDTPGILEPKFENKINGINLALIGSIKENILPINELSYFALDFLRLNYKKEVENRYKIENISIISNEEFFKIVAKNRGFLLTGNSLDVEKAEYIFLNEFKNGIITKFTLERP